EEWQDESSKKGNGFLSDLTAQWELAADLEKIKIRKVHIRIGIVLDSTDGALKKMTPLFNWRLGSVLGSGGQFMSWIHLSDLVSMFLFCASNESVVGIVNGTAPEPVTNRTFTEAMEQALQKKQFAPSVPSWLLKLVMGEMSTLVLMSQRCSAKKITNAGFNFQFNTIQQALNNIYGKA
ncbi:MAG: DUF1731 domain-containing protein, partial [Bacteroidota bacterium]